MVKVEATPEVAEPVTVHDEYCCNASRRSPEEVAARKVRRAHAYDEAVRLLAMAEKAAIRGGAETAKALTDIASAWDSISY